MHPHLTMILAGQRVADLHRCAERSRLDRAPKGRDEEALLRGEGEWWWRRHDEYGDA